MFFEQDKDSGEESLLEADEAPGGSGDTSEQQPDIGGVDSIAERVADSVVGREQPEHVVQA